MNADLHGKNWSAAALDLLRASWASCCCKAANACDMIRPLKVKTSDKTKVSTRRGGIVSNALVTKQIGKGAIYIQFHYSEAPANKLMIATLDPVAKIPELKVCAARVERAS